jgi:hypothetical protein
MGGGGQRQVAGSEIRTGGRGGRGESGNPDKLVVYSNYGFLQDILSGQ